MGSFNKYNEIEVEQWDSNRSGTKARSPGLKSDKITVLKLKYIFPKSWNREHAFRIPVSDTWETSASSQTQKLP